MVTCRCNYGGLVLTKITFLTNQYEFLKNDPNEHGSYFLKCYYFITLIIHVQWPTNLPKFMWKLVYNVVDVIF